MRVSAAAEIASSRGEDSNCKQANDHAIFARPRESIPSTFSKDCVASISVANSSLCVTSWPLGHLAILCNAVATAT